MAKRHFLVEVTGTVRVEIDDEIVTPEFMEEFSRSIFFLDTLEEMSQHIGFNVAANNEFKFIEGVGDLREAGVRVGEALWDTAAHETDEHYDGFGKLPRDIPR